MTAQVKVRCRINGGLRMLKPQGMDIEDLFKEALKTDGRICAWREKDKTDLLPLCGDLDPIIGRGGKTFEFLQEFNLPVVLGTVNKTINVKRDSTFARSLGVSEGADLMVSNGEKNVDVKGSDIILERIKPLIGHGAISITLLEPKYPNTPQGPSSHGKQKPPGEHGTIPIVKPKPGSGPKANPYVPTKEGSDCVQNGRQPLNMPNLVYPSVSDLPVTNPYSRPCETSPSPTGQISPAPPDAERTSGRQHTKHSDKSPAPAPSSTRPSSEDTYSEKELQMMDDYTVVVIDDSGSMRLQFGNEDCSKLETAKYIVDGLRKRIGGMQMFCGFSMVFLSQIERHDLAVHGNIPCKPDSQGRTTPLCARLSQLIEKLAAKRGVDHLRKRILVISDGEESSHDGRDQYIELCKFAHRAGVVIDSIILDGGTSQLCPLSRMSGGYSFLVATTADAEQVMKCQLVLDLRIREKVPPIPVNAQNWDFVEKLGFTKIECLNELWTPVVYKYPHELVQLSKCPKTEYSEGIQKIQMENECIKEVFQAYNEFQWILLLEVKEGVIYELVARFLPNRELVFLFPSVVGIPKTLIKDELTRIANCNREYIKQFLRQMANEIDPKQLTKHLEYNRTHFPHRVTAPFSNMEMFLALHKVGET